MGDAKWTVGTGIAMVTMMLGVTVPLLLGVRTDIRDINGWIRQHLTDHAASVGGSGPGARPVHDLPTDQRLARRGGQSTAEALSNPPEDTSELAIEALYSMADQGNAEAQDNLGVLYLTGQGIPQNYTEAVE